MIYTVYKGDGRGMGAVARELHETAQAVTDDIMRYRSIALTVDILTTLESESRQFGV